MWGGKKNKLAKKKKKQTKREGKDGMSTSHFF